jgi:hypothetical protein
MLTRSARSAICVVAASLVLAGCGGQTTGEVSGLVTVDGVPVEIGVVRFSALDGTGQPKGGEIRDGKYTVRDVPLGVMKVEIVGSKHGPKTKLYNTANSPEVSKPIRVVPERYNEKSDLKFDVKPGANQKDWELHSK